MFYGFSLSLFMKEVTYVEFVGLLRDEAAETSGLRIEFARKLGRETIFSFKHLREGFYYQNVYKNN